MRKSGRGRRTLPPRRAPRSAPTPNPTMNPIRIRPIVSPAVFPERMPTMITPKTPAEIPLTAPVMDPSRAADGSRRSRSQSVGVAGLVGRPAGLDEGSSMGSLSADANLYSHAAHLILFRGRPSGTRFSWPHAGHLKTCTMHPPIEPASRGSANMYSRSPKQKDVMQTTYLVGTIWESTLKTISIFQRR
jgi:hypothetical protein